MFRRREKVKSVKENNRIKILFWFPKRMSGRLELKGMLQLTPPTPSRQQTTGNPPVHCGLGCHQKWLSSVWINNPSFYQCQLVTTVQTLTPNYFNISFFHFCSHFMDDKCALPVPWLGSGIWADNENFVLSVWCVVTSPEHLHHRRSPALWRAVCWSSSGSPTTGGTWSMWSKAARSNSTWESKSRQSCNIKNITTSNVKTSL